jgi:hypothetical protein
MKMKRYDLTCAVDLDGVLFDFSGRLKEITGKPAEELSRGYLWHSVQKYNDTVAPFFETLDLLPDAHELWAYVTARFDHVFILTATGWTPKDGEDQKRRAVAKHFGQQTHVKVVTSGSLKAQFATPTTILIDDTRKAFDPWVAAGGIGVFHTSAADSIKQLESILHQTQV